MSLKPTDYNLLTDEKLLALMKKGDSKALDAIYLRYWEQLTDLANKLSGNPIRNLTIVQDIFNELWSGKERREILELVTYLEMRVHYKINRMGKRIIDDSLPEFETSENMSIYSLQEDSKLNDVELKGCIALWLTMNKGQGSDIFTMRFLEDNSIAKISILLNIPEKSVENQLLLTYNRLRTFLRKMVPILLIGTIG